MNKNTMEQLRASVLDETVKKETIDILKRLVGDVENNLLPVFQKHHDVREETRARLMDKAIRSVIVNFIMHAVHPAGRDYFMADVMKGLEEGGKLELAQLQRDVAQIAKKGIIQ